MRQCPTPEGGPGSRSLFTHRISVSECAERQREQYHKCHYCVLRGKPPEFGLGECNGVHRNGTTAPVERIVELRRNGPVELIRQAEPVVPG